MFSIKSSYPSLYAETSSYNSNISDRQQMITPGICDYIPQSYFTKQYFSIYIEGGNQDQIMQSILWNQFYQKTLLKQIYFQLSINNKKCDNTLMQKYDTILAKANNNNQIIYLKIQSLAYNLKDKLQFHSYKTLEKQIKSAKTLTIQKITQQGKWKKVKIDFGPYKNKNQFDIVFTCNAVNNYIPQASLQRESIKDKVNISKSNKKSICHTTKKQKQNTNDKISFIVKDRSVSQFNVSNKNRISQLNSSVKKKKEQKNSHISKTSHKQTKCQTVNLMQSNTSKKSQHSKTSNNNQFQGIMQFTPNQLGILQQVNFNSTAKLFQNQTQKNSLISSNMIPVSLDLQRKQKFKVKQNSILQKQNFLPLQSQIHSKMISQASKMNSVMAQILSKKEEIIYSQKKKAEQIQQKYLREIQELKMKQVKQTQMFKNQISSLLNQYSKKYEEQQAQSKVYREEINVLNKVLTQTKVSVAQLQGKNKCGEQQAGKYKKQLTETQQKLKEIQQRYYQLQLFSRQEQNRLLKQKNEIKIQKDKYFKKYTLLSKKVKVLVHQEHNPIEQD